MYEFIIKIISVFVLQIEYGESVRDGPVCVKMVGRVARRFGSARRAAAFIPEVKTSVHGLLLGRHVRYRLG